MRIRDLCGQLESLLPTKPGALRPSTLQRATDECVVQCCFSALSTAASSLKEPGRYNSMGGGPWPVCAAILLIKRCLHIVPRVCTLVVFISDSGHLNFTFIHIYFNNQRTFPCLCGTSINSIKGISLSSSAQCSGRMVDGLGAMASV